MLGRYDRRSSSMAHSPGSSLIYARVTMIPGLFGVLAVPTSTTWRILYLMSLSVAEVRTPGKLSWVHDQRATSAQENNRAYAWIASGL